MKAAIIVAVAVLGAQVKPQPDRPAPARSTEVAMMCFKTGENAPSGSMTKICYYDCLGSPVAITISSVSLCPLSINR